MEEQSPLPTYSPQIVRRSPNSPKSRSPVHHPQPQHSPNLSRLGWAQSLVYSSHARHRVLVAGRRFGKSHLSISEAKRTALDPSARPKWVRLLYPKVEIKYFYPTYKQAKTFIWEPLKEQTKPWYSRRPNNTDLQIFLNSPSGQTATISLVGCDVDPDKHRGGGLDLAIYDECAFISDLAAVRRVIKPSIAERVGRELYISSPNQHNEFYTLYQSVKDRKIHPPNEWEAFQFTTIQGGRIPASEIEKDRHSMTRKTFNQEYLATFESTSDGNCYYAFSDENILSSPVEFNPQSPLILSIDLNVNPLTGVLMQKWEPTGYSHVSDSPYPSSPVTRYYVLDEIYLNHATTYDLMAAFKEKTLRWANQVRGKLQVWFYGDATMSHSQTASRHSDYAIIKKWFAGQDKYNLVDKVPSSNPEVRSRVEAVNSFLENAANTRRLFINPNCEHLINDMRRVVWADGLGLREDQKTDKSLTHISSAMGYFLHPVSEFSSHTEFF